MSVEAVAELHFTAKHSGSKIGRLSAYLSAKSSACIGYLWAFPSARIIGLAFAMLQDRKANPPR